MRCLLCNFTLTDSEDVKEYYVDFHKVDRDNQLFTNLFQRQNNIFHQRKCLRCDEFLLNHRFKAKHDFLVHYGAGRDALEEKSLNYTRLGEIQEHEITFTHNTRRIMIFITLKS